MIGAALIAMMAALSAQAGPAEQAPEPELVERVALQYPIPAFRDDVIARCRVTFDIRPDGSTTNRCGVCRAASPHDDVKSERYEKSFVRESLKEVRHFRFEETENGFSGYHQAFDFNLDHLNPALIESIEKPDAPVCGKARR